MQKELQSKNKEITLIGIVREIEDKQNSYQVGIADGNEIYVVKLNAEGKHLQYEVGSKVEATGVISTTKDGLRRIAVTNYEVYEMDEDDLDDFGADADGY